MDFITGRIAIGNRHESADIETLQAHGITAVLNVAYDLDISYFNPHSLSHLPAAAAAQACRFSIEYHKVGLIDGSGNQPTALAAAVYTLAQLLQRHDKVFVHCHAGVSRAPTVVSTYLAHTEGISFNDALAIVQSRRPNANPNSHLKELAQSLPTLF